MVKVCPDCGQEFSTGAGLASHRRAKHGEPASWGPNRRAFEVTLQELRGEERLARVDAARVQAARSLADAVDAERTNAQLWRTYREAVEALVGERDDSDSFEKLLAEINSRASLGHSTEA